MRNGIVTRQPGRQRRDLLEARPQRLRFQIFTQPGQLIRPAELAHSRAG